MFYSLKGAVPDYPNQLSLFTQVIQQPTSLHFEFTYSLICFYLSLLDYSYMRVILLHSLHILAQQETFVHYTEQISGKTKATQFHLFRHSKKYLFGGQFLWSCYRPEVERATLHSVYSKLTNSNVNSSRSSQLIYSFL